MQRRTLLKLAALSSLSAGSTPSLRALLGEPVRDSSRIDTVLLVTKCHLDVGFTQTQAKVMRKYFDVYYPAAIQTADNLRKAGGDGYTWTTGSWLLYEYLEQADTAQRRTMEEAVAAGYIDWHALPFSWQTEMLDRSMIEGALGFSATLDRRFGRKTIGAKMTDVPGHSRGIIAPLHDAGIRLLDVGVNAASTPPDVPDVFLWKDSTGKDLAMLYHRHDYGSLIEIPNSSVAVDVEVRGDNSGPHTPAEIAAIYARLRAHYPNARIKASNMNEVASAVDQVRAQLPVITAEIGDTWIYGCASDPNKVSRYREVARLRKTWVSQKKFVSGDDTDRRLLRRLLLAPEHTWGTDTKTYLDNQHYRPADLAAVLGEPGYQVMQVSWKEKNDDIDEGVASLPEPLKKQADEALRDLRTTTPSTENMTAHDATQAFESRHFTLVVDPETGAIVRLREKKTGREWASKAKPLALFTYQTLSTEQYAAFMAKYITIKADWAPRDFGKPGIDAFHAVAAEWHPRVMACYSSQQHDDMQIVLQLGIKDAEAAVTGNTAWPASIFVQLSLPAAKPSIELRVTTGHKQANRLPEAMWMTFDPADARPDGWALDKVDERVSPLDVVSGGGRAMHAVSDAVHYKDAQGSLTINTLDAPVVAVGQRSPLNFSTQLPDLASGIHFSLFNNAWGTNYPQWCGGDWSFRFQLSFT